MNTKITELKKDLVNVINKYEFPIDIIDLVLENLRLELNKLVSDQITKALSDELNKLKSSYSEPSEPDDSVENKSEDNK